MIDFTRMFYGIYEVFFVIGLRLVVVRDAVSWDEMYVFSILSTMNLAED